MEPQKSPKMTKCISKGPHGSNRTKKHENCPAWDPLHLPKLHEGSQKSLFSYVQRHTTNGPQKAPIWEGCGLKNFKNMSLAGTPKNAPKIKPKNVSFWGTPFLQKPRLRSRLWRLGTQVSLPSLPKAPQGRIWHHFDPMLSKRGCIFAHFVAQLYPKSCNNNCLGHLGSSKGLSSLPQETYIKHAFSKPLPCITLLVVTSITCIFHPARFGLTCARSKE